MARFFTETKQAQADAPRLMLSRDLEVLSHVPAIVQKVKIDGVGRTKDTVFKREFERIVTQAEKPSVLVGGFRADHDQRPENGARAIGKRKTGKRRSSSSVGNPHTTLAVKPTRKLEKAKAQ